MSLTAALAVVPALIQNTALYVCGPHYFSVVKAHSLGRVANTRYYQSLKTERIFSKENHVICKHITEEVSIFITSYVSVIALVNPLKLVLPCFSLKTFFCVKLTKKRLVR